MNVTVVPAVPATVTTASVVAYELVAESNAVFNCSVMVPVTVGSPSLTVSTTVVPSASAKAPATPPTRADASIVPM